jgi:hypothetical protein
MGVEGMPSQSQTFAQSAVVLGLGWITGLIWGTAPAIAHQIEVAEDVGATMHVEPNDIATAGTPQVIWFALTRSGGETIPLEDCDCAIAIYAQGQSDVETPLLIPDLMPVSAEGYTDIPGASVTFPDVGVYTIALMGSPIQPEDFQPFELQFEITVAASTVNPTPTQSPSGESPISESPTGESPTGESTDEAQPNTPAPGSMIGWMMGAIALLVAGGTGLYVWATRRR